VGEIGDMAVRAQFRGDRASPVRRSADNDDPITSLRQQPGGGGADPAA
jgi:hypothetical protein